MRNGFWLGLVLLTVHLVVCGGLWLLARARTLEVEGYFVPVMLLVPLWGPHVQSPYRRVPAGTDTGKAANKRGNIQKYPCGR